MENVSQDHQEEQEKGFINWEYVAKGIIVTVATLGIGGIILVLAMVTMTTPLLKVCIGVVGVILGFVACMGWKLITLTFEVPVLPPPNNAVLLRSYSYNSPYSPGFSAPGRMELPFTIPRPMISPDPFAPPSRLAPPPPSYALSQTVHNSTAPPPYSNNGILRRSASNSPPPQYPHNLNSPPPIHAQRSRRVVIDCSKAEPTLYTTPTSESVI